MKCSAHDLTLGPFSFRSGASALARSIVSSLRQKRISLKKWGLAGLQCISDITEEMHFGLYERYVKNANLLDERLAADPTYADLVRGLGFAYTACDCRPAHGFAR